MAVIGADAAEGRLGGYSGPGRRVVTALDALHARLGAARVTFARGPGRSRARDTTISSAHLRTPGGEPGLGATYFSGPDLDGASVAQRTEAAIDFHWTFLPPVPGVAPDWFSARWEGTLVPDRTGRLELSVEGTDGFRLWLGDTLVMDEWAGQGQRRRAVPLAAVRGRGVALRLEARQPAANGRLRLAWSAGVVDSSEQEIRRAVLAARGADVAIVMPGLEEGEFRDRASLALPGRQEELIRRVAATGTPVVVVLVGGSAVTMPWLDRVGAVLDVWYPGEAGGEALAALLLGEANPAGRLPITFPVAEGQLPLSYRHAPTGRGDDYTDLTGLPLFPFGFGLSYTRFAYSDLRLTGEAAQGIRVTCTIRNTGPRAGDEVVQVYLRDPVASVTRPVLALAGFTRVTLAPGEAQDVELLLPRAVFEVPGPDLAPVLEPGAVTLLVGASSRDLRLRGEVMVR
ncbi:MAG: glycoside hydrolase family 3 C-terminal domain-containing protein [Gemmatimonadetes bacterium]|nr:glycoside hydrolase family 3 C-terminal domain-containing protein [Gemmatimonadota bacterium]